MRPDRHSTQLPGVESRLQVMCYKTGKEQLTTSAAARKREGDCPQRNGSGSFEGINDEEMQEHRASEIKRSGHASGCCVLEQAAAHGLMKCGLRPGC